MCVSRARRFGKSMATKSKYAIIRKLPTDKGFADLVFVPLREVDLPAIVLELNIIQETGLSSFYDWLG